MDRNKNCCFTGHRIEKLPWRENERDPRCIKLKNSISEAVKNAYRSGIRHYICGMATGCDMYFCEAAIALRDQHKDVTIEAAIPWDGQASAWSCELRRRHSRLVEECDFITVVQHEYSADCLMKRNRYMVDNARLIIAAYNGKPGGTMSTMLYAIRQGIELVEIFIE